MLQAPKDQNLHVCLYNIYLQDIYNHSNVYQWELSALCITI